MEAAIGTMIFLGLITIALGSVIGGVILMLLAKYVGKIENAKFGNSFMVCLLSSATVGVVWYLFWWMALSMTGANVIIQMGVGGLMVFNVVVLSAVYIAIGKKIWQSGWMQSVKANIIWIGLYAAFMGFALDKVM